MEVHLSKLQFNHPWSHRFGQARLHCTPTIYIQCQLYLKIVGLLMSGQHSFELISCLVGQAFYHGRLFSACHFCLVGNSHTAHVVNYINLLTLTELFLHTCIHARTHTHTRIHTHTTHTHHTTHTPLCRYKWTILVCRSCGHHRGWLFEATKKNLVPTKFYGLTRQGLVLTSPQQSISDNAATQNT